MARWSLRRDLWPDGGDDDRPQPPPYFSPWEAMRMNAPDWDAYWAQLTRYILTLDILAGYLCAQRERHRTGAIGGPRDGDTWRPPLPGAGVGG